MENQRRDTIAALHTPVMCERIIELFAPVLNHTQNGHPPILIDATLGMGGHSEAILRNFPQAEVIGIDRDPAAITLASERLAPYGARFRAVQTTYDHINEVAATFSAGNSGKVDAVLMDLGVSSLQLDDDERGFSYSRPTELDMRMNPDDPVNAKNLVNQLDVNELTQILRDYGQERYAGRIARRIVKAREGQPILTSDQLAELVREAIPAPARRTGGNPCKRTFQALRIAVNDELAILRRAVPLALASVRVGGRVVVESYQSLEDRIVKQVFQAGCVDQTPADLPVMDHNLAPKLRCLTRGAHKPTDDEVAANPRAQSVRLRAVEVIRPYVTQTPAVRDQQPFNQFRNSGRIPR